MAKQSPEETRPRISVIERRLAAPSVFRTGSVEIPLKDPTWTLRWENAEIAPDHLYRVLHQLGWVYATPEDLGCAVEEIGAFERDGRIVRGARGTEVLLKMRTSDYTAIQRRKSEEVTKSTFGKKAIKDAIVSGVGSAHGDEAASFVSQHVNAITVTDARGREDA